MTTLGSLYDSREAKNKIVNIIKDKYKDNVRVMNNSYADGTTLVFNFEDAENEDEDILVVELILRERRGTLLVVIEDPRTDLEAVTNRSTIEYNPAKFESYGKDYFNKMVDLILDNIEETLIAE